MRYSRENILSYLIYFVFSLAEIVLFLRLILRLFGASTESSFVQFIYNSSAVLLDPFRGIFTPAEVAPGAFLEFTTLFAIVIYALIAFLITEFIDFIVFNAGNTYRRV